MYFMWIMVYVTKNRKVFSMYLHIGKDYIINNSMTYGYYNIQNAINDFNRELYNLYSRYNIIFDNIKQEIPESEKNTIDAYLSNNVFNKELVNLNNVMR